MRFSNVNKKNLLVLGTVVKINCQLYYKKLWALIAAKFRNLHHDKEVCNQVPKRKSCQNCLVAAQPPDRMNVEVSIKSPCFSYVDPAIALHQYARGASCPCGCCWWVVGLMTGWVVIKSIIWFPLFQVWAMKMRRFQVWSPKMSMYLLSKVVSIWILKIWKFKTYSPKETGAKTLARKVVLDPGEVIKNF